ncbi:hypothetical protein CG719_23810 [Streptomyces sp. CB01373]|nr:hypothetical protein CG719_23810 [Streptomyces sp. CB01373]
MDEAPAGPLRGNLEGRGRGFHLVRGFTAGFAAARLPVPGGAAIVEASAAVRRRPEVMVGAMARPIVRWGAALGLGAAWWWAVLRLLLSGDAGVLEGAVAAGGWGLSLLPVHCVPKEGAGERGKGSHKEGAREEPGEGQDGGLGTSAPTDGDEASFPASEGWPYGAFGASPSAGGRWPFGTAKASPPPRSDGESGPS